MTIQKALSSASEFLAKTSQSPRLDAELLLAMLLKKPRSYLLAHSDESLSYIQHTQFRLLLNKRRRGLPIAYITGHKEFYGLDFFVNRYVLVPRPDTEVLVENVIQFIKNDLVNAQAQTLLVDVGTGSGCIPIAVCSHVDGIKAFGLDISTKALQVARINVNKHHLDERIEFVQSDLFSALPEALFRTHDVIVTANLPYLPNKMEGSPELDREPKLALYSGDDGLVLYKKFVQQIERLKPKAVFAELFSNQVQPLFSQLSGYESPEITAMSGKAVMVKIKRFPPKADGEY